MQRLDHYYRSDYDVFTSLLCLAQVQQCASSPVFVIFRSICEQGGSNEQKYCPNNEHHSMLQNRMNKAMLVNCKMFSSFSLQTLLPEKQCFLVCPPSGNLARKKYFLVCPPSGNLARKKYFLLCPPSRKMARRKYFLVCSPSGNS